MFPYTAIFLLHHYFGCLYVMQIQIFKKSDWDKNWLDTKKRYTFLRDGLWWKVSYLYKQILLRWHNVLWLKHFCTLSFQKSMASLNDTHTTGIAMLFSAGTFLYVATVHVLPEIANRQTKQTLQDGSVVIHDHKGFAKLDLVALVFGAIVPVILSIGHKHWAFNVS